MRKIIAILLFIFIPSCLIGQISIRQANIVEKAVLRPLKFDSLENIKKTDRGKEHNLLKYLEQEVFLIPINTETKISPSRSEFCKSSA